MAQANKTCPYCFAVGHSGFYCPKKPVKPIKSRSKQLKAVKTVSKPKKKLAPSRSKLVKDLDGYCICVTSGVRMFWTEAQNGHFFSRRFYPTRWNDDNCHPQSMRDNVFLKGNYINYTRYMIDSYGRKFVDDLEKLAHTTIKIRNAELIEKIQHYKKEVKRLKLEKGLV